MTKPSLYLVRMALFLVLVAGLASPLHEQLLSAFMTNAPLNGAILAVLVLGIGYNFLQVIRLYPEVSWLESYRRDGLQLSDHAQPRLLGPMANMLGERRDSRLFLSTTSMRTLLDGILSRLDDSRDISRYAVGLLIFLGLLGTFWGLLETLGSVRGVIGNLSVTGDDAASVFEELKAGLERPLAGMGTAFSSSLFGLAGSLILGFLELQASQAQNRFTTELEEWLSGLTRLSSGVLAGDGEHSVSAYVQALLEQTAESLDSLQRIISRGEESRTAVNDQILALTGRLEMLSEHMRTQQMLMKEMAQGQADLRPALMQIADNSSLAGSGMDQATRNAIKNLDRHMSVLTTDVAQGRDELIREIRSEIKILARTIAAAADGNAKGKADG